MPAEVGSLLKRRRLDKRYRARPPYQRNDYLWWIGAAKRESTRAKRIDQMLRELKAGDSYMGMRWAAGTRTGGKSMTRRRGPRAKSKATRR
jgi:Bacteriocin-protection, YdeI or OmpD-Associated